jgi:hypothetical protein
MGYWPYKDLFQKYQADCTIFFETGTYKGDSVQDALDLGFERIISVESNKEFFDYCMERFQPLNVWEQVKLFYGRSENQMEPLLRDWVNSRTLFWLDAHETGSPYKVEIEAILNHPINNHNIIIDDINNFGIDINWIKNTLASYNPLYKFTTTKISTSEQLIAYI